jgi:hypothetical protein
VAKEQVGALFQAVYAAAVVGLPVIFQVSPTGNTRVVVRVGESGLEAEISADGERNATAVIWQEIGFQRAKRLFKKDDELDDWIDSHKDVG